MNRRKFLTAIGLAPIAATIPVATTIPVAAKSAVVGEFGPESIVPLYDRCVRAGFEAYTKSLATASQRASARTIGTPPEQKL